MPDMVQPICLESHRRAAKPLAAQCAVRVDLPIRADASAELHALLRRTHLAAEARWIWMAFPTLKAAAENAISLVSLAWPDPDQPNASACGDAIERAMRTVLSCREEGEHVRDEVIGRFLEKLAAVAGAVARTTASGLVRDSAVAQYDHNQWNFVAWADSGGFDAVGFTFRAAVRESDRRGIETVFVSKAAASTRDVGCYLRHRA